MDWQGRTTEYKYDANGRIKETKRPNGSVETVEYENGRVEKVTDKGKHGTISETTYAYDKNGNVTKENDTTYTYDDSGCVTMVTTGDGKTYEYSYDQNGNLIDESDNGDGNRLSKYDNDQIKIDKDGNMTKGPLSGKSIEYQYNKLNQLVKLGETEYTYDVNGNRISMMDKNDKTTYVTDINAELPRLLIRENPDGGRTFYVYGHDLISQETVDREGNWKDYRLFHYDYRGSTNSLTDGDGNVTDRVGYSPYGEVEAREGNTETIFLYVGQEGIQTDDNGLLYMRARYYNPEVGRFINEDPIRDGHNWYYYCEGDPVNKVDPSELTYIIAWSYGKKDVKAFEEYFVKRRWGKVTIDGDTKDWSKRMWKQFNKRSSFARAAKTRKRDLLAMGIPTSDIVFERVDNKNDLIKILIFLMVQVITQELKHTVLHWESTWVYIISYLD